MNILLVVEHTLFREGLKLLLQKSYPLSWFEEANSLSMALSVLESRTPDFVLVDIKLKDTIGLDSVRALQKSTPITPVVAIADDFDFHLANLALSFGASAYISKTSSYVEFEKAISKVTSGQTYLPPELRQHALDDITSRRPASDISILSSLSDRQKEVLKHIATGSSNKRISEELKISQNTVKAHLATIFKILGVHNRTEAFYFSTRAGLPLD